MLHSPFQSWIWDWGTWNQEWNVGLLRTGFTGLDSLRLSCARYEVSNINSFHVKHFFHFFCCIWKFHFLFVHFKLELFYDEYYILLRWSCLMFSVSVNSCYSASSICLLCFGHSLKRDLRQAEDAWERTNARFYYFFISLNMALFTKFGLLGYWL